MGMLDKMKNALGLEPIDDDEEITEEEIKRATEKQNAPGHRGADVGVMPNTRQSYKEKVVPMNGPVINNQSASRGTNPFKLMVIEPQGFEECPKFVDMLKMRKPVIINLENIDVDTARKMFDFMSGATYALNGTVQPVTDNIFVFAPESVDVTTSMPTSGKKSFDDKDKKPWR